MIFFIIVQKNKSNNKVTLRTLEVNSRGQKQPLYLLSTSPQLVQFLNITIPRSLSGTPCMYILKEEGCQNLHWYDTKERLSMTDDFGNVGCGIFKWWEQNWEDFCLRIHIPKENYWIHRFSDKQSFFENWIEIFCLVKFMFSKKATKIDEIFTVNLTLTT